MKSFQTRRNKQYNKTVKTRIKRRNSTPKQIKKSYMQPKKTIIEEKKKIKLVMPAMQKILKKILIPKVMAKTYFG